MATKAQRRNAFIFGLSDLATGYAVRVCERLAIRVDSEQGRLIAQAFVDGADAALAAEDGRDRPRSLGMPAKKKPRCADCGEEGETIGHMGCQYPQDHA